MPVQLANYQRRIRVSSSRIRKESLELLRWSGLQKAELGITISGAGRMKTLNRSFRGKDKPTDVLSFPFHEEKELKRLSVRSARGALGGVPFILGEIVICPEVAAANAALYGSTLEQEMSRLLVHGFLHLLGYDHEKDESGARRMRRKERQLLNALERMD